MPLFDLHVHTSYCGHAAGSAEETVQQAIQKKFRVLGFSEHFPYPEKYVEPIPGCVVPGNRWTEYMNEIRRLQSSYAGQLDIRIGVEIDYLPAHEKEITEAVKSYEFDYIYGSVHLINDIGIDYQEGYLKERIHQLGGPDGLWETYWVMMEKMIRLNMCDIIAHLDLPKKLKCAQPSKDQTDAIRSILELIKQNDLVLEINTGGIDRGCLREPYPSRLILQHAAELGIEMTLGSDAHAPGQIGRHFDVAVGLLKIYGWHKVVIFKNRKKEYISLNEVLMPSM
ncbi:histidinol-phosphatase HisJ [bacterium]|nr:histidinol-phosphatase HisJ [bacterium]